MSQKIYDSSKVTLDGSGNGTVTLGPGRPNMRWVIKGISVQVSSNVNEPVANIYRGSVNPGSFISGTYNGSNDADNELNETLYPGEFLTVQWTDGDSGAQATASYRGELITREEE